MSLRKGKKSKDAAGISRDNIIADEEDISDKTIFEDGEATTRRSIRKSDSIYSKVMRKLRIIFLSHPMWAPTLFFMMQRLLAVGVMEKFFLKVVMTQEKCWIIFLTKALRGRALNVLEEILKLSESTKE